MKARTALASLACLLAGVAMGATVDAHMGTWKLNESKSKLAAGATKNHTVIYTAADDGLKVTVDGTTSDGKPVHNEWTGKVDGTDYPVTGGANEDTRSYKEIDDRTLEFVGKSGGKVTVTGRVQISSDGKTRTVTTVATDAKGKKTKGTAVYDKQ
jgi:RNase P/RNase MRP subunit p29